MPGQAIAIAHGIPCTGRKAHKNTVPTAPGVYDCQHKGCHGQFQVAPDQAYVAYHMHVKVAKFGEDFEQKRADDLWAQYDAEMVAYKRRKAEVDEHNAMVVARRADTRDQVSLNSQSRRDRAAALAYADSLEKQLLQDERLARTIDHGLKRSRAKRQPTLPTTDNIHLLPEPVAPTPPRVPRTITRREVQPTKKDRGRVYDPTTPIDHKGLKQIFGNDRQIPAEVGAPYVSPPAPGARAATPHIYVSPLPGARAAVPPATTDMRGHPRPAHRIQEQKQRSDEAYGQVPGSSRSRQLMPQAPAYYRQGGPIQAMSQPQYSYSNPSSSNSRQQQAPLAGSSRHPQDGYYVPVTRAAQPASSGRSRHAGDAGYYSPSSDDVTYPPAAMVRGGQHNQYEQAAPMEPRPVQRQKGSRAVGGSSGRSCGPCDSTLCMICCASLCSG